MKKILLSIFLLFTLCSSFAQIPFNGSLLIKSGLKKNTIVYGADTLKFGWESGSVFSISKANGQRLAKFSMNDSSTIIYNKLILQSPNDTMLSVRGTVKVMENVVLGDSNNYYEIDTIPNGDGIVQWGIANAGNTTLTLYATYSFEESDLNELEQFDLVLFTDSFGNYYHATVTSVIPETYKGGSIYTPRRVIFDFPNVDYWVLHVSENNPLFKTAIASVSGTQSVIIGDNNIIDNEKVLIIGDSITTRSNNSLYINNSIVMGEVAISDKVITDWISNSEKLIDMYSEPAILHFTDSAAGVFSVGDVIIMSSSIEIEPMVWQLDSTVRGAFRVDSIVSMGVDSLYYYVTTLAGTIEDSYDNSDWGAYKGFFIEGGTHNAINIGSDNTIANKGSHIIGLKRLHYYS